MKSIESLSAYLFSLFGLAWGINNFEAGFYLLLVAVFFFVISDLQH